MASSEFQNPLGWSNVIVRRYVSKQYHIKKKDFNKMRLFFLFVLIFKIIFTKSQLNRELRINNQLVIKKKIYVSQNTSIYFTM